MKEFFSKLFASDFMPHATCYLWKSDVLWLNVVSDFLIALAYYSIPVALAVFVQRRKDMVFKSVFWLFAAFILLCGTTHVMEIFTVWTPAYRLSGLIKLITGIVSVVTAAMIWPLIPKALLIPSVSDLQQVNEELKMQIEVRLRIEEELQRHKDQLESLISERTRQLENTNLELKQKIRDFKSAQQQIVFQASLLDQVKSSVIALNLQRQVLYWNRGAEELYGWTTEEALGRYIEDLIYPEELYKEASKTFRQVYETGMLETETYLRRKDGSLKPVMLTRSLVRDEEGKITGFMSISSDISERKKAEEELRNAKERAEEALQNLAREMQERKEAQKQIVFQASLLDQVKNAVMVTDFNYHLIYWNKFSEELFGWKAEEVLGKRTIDIFRLEDNPQRQAMIRETIMTKNFWEGEYKVATKSGKVIPALVTGSFMRDEEGQPGGLIAVAVDISERKRTEEELRQAKERAEESARAKQEFLSIMSHEIRTPLNAVIGVTHLLTQDEPKPEQLDNLNILQVSAQNLLALINDILDFSKIESRKVEFECISFSLHDLIRDVVSTFSYQIAEKGLTLKVTIDEVLPKVLMGDPMRLTQILNNLLSNAIKFTEKGHVDLSVQVEVMHGELISVRFNIADTGIGIEADKIDAIFDSFSQANTSTTRRYGGTGLGLTISKMLVELQGGKIKVESQPGAGTVFSFALLYRISSADMPAHSAAKHTPGEGSLEGMTILLVDDNPVNQAIAAKFLNRWKAVTDVAENGQKAVEQAQKQDYDLILMDLRMPVMDGYEATRQIRALGKTMPILALTASVMSEVHGRVQEAGMNDYIFKPINPEDLYRKILKYSKTMARHTAQLVQSTEREVMSLKALITDAASDREFVESLLTMYEQEFESLPDMIRQYTRAGDVIQLGDLIHRVVPSLQRLSQQTLEQEMRRLKRLLKERTEATQVIEEVLHKIDQSVKEVLDEVETIRKSVSSEQ